MRSAFLFIATMALSLLLALVGGSPILWRLPVPTPTITPTLTSQPADPILKYPPEGAVLTKSITIQDLEFIYTGFIALVTITGDNFTARWCIPFNGEGCNPWDFENENTLLPDGEYTWKVYTWKPLGSASTAGTFRVDTHQFSNLPPMITATPTPG
jgi:hypothetical protein